MAALNIDWLMVIHRLRFDFELLRTALFNFETVNVVGYKSGDSFHSIGADIEVTEIIEQLFAADKINNRFNLILSIHISNGSYAIAEFCPSVCQYNACN